MKKYLCSLVFAGSLLLQPSLSATQASGTQPSPSSGTPAIPHKARTATAAPSAAAPTAQEIADAKSKGMVWANTNTKVYHKDGSFYGTTKHGKFMTEEEAKQAGYRAAKTSGSKTKTSPATPPK